MEQLGILTKEKIRKYPLRLSNLQVVLKVYAVQNNIPFTYNVRGMGKTNSEYYLTDTGLEWLYDFFRSKTPEFCRTLFGPLFARAAEEHMKNIESYPYLNNFRGLIGRNAEAGTKQRAMIIRKVKRCERRYEFDTIKEAREQLRIWLAYYPIEEFKLYRVRTVDGHTYKEEIPLIIAQKTHYCAGKTDWRKI